MDEVNQTNRLLHRLALYPPHALPTAWIPMEVREDMNLGLTYIA